MAGTVTTAELNPVENLTKIQFDWLSDANGDATADTTKVYTGEIILAVFEPDSGGTQPTDQYDVEVTDADGYDVLNVQGANCSNAANAIKTKEDKLGAVVGSILSLAVSNAGNAKGGIVTLIIR